ncbi:MAG TPA: helix-turn-helix transcriptional regulator [Candidatus Dormibacteraeota bacterium]|nr:helix-turn-helix transcriptional regulator [Candidatus Dormibacteraeota bacterium]
MRLSEMPTAEEVLARLLECPEFRREWERTAFARAVALRVVAYRAEHGISQSDLGKKLELSQPAVARLEIGEHEPTFATLCKLSRALGINFHIEVTPDSLSLSE